MHSLLGFLFSVSSCKRKKITRPHHQNGYSLILLVTVPYLLLNLDLSFSQLDKVSYTYVPLCFRQTYPCCINHHKLSGKNRNLASTLYIGSKSSTKYFCLYEKQKEQATKKKHTDIINRFEIRLRDKKAVQAVEELLLTYNPHGLVFYLITDFVEFPDYPLWEIFISHDNLPFEMNPVPVNMERTLQWLERQVMPSIVMIEEIDRLTGSNYMKMIDECTHLSEKQEMLVEQMCTDIADVIESEGVFYA